MEEHWKLNKQQLIAPRGLLRVNFSCLGEKHGKTEDSESLPEKEVHAFRDLFKMAFKLVSGPLQERQGGIDVKTTVVCDVSHCLSVYQLLLVSWLVIYYTLLNLMLAADEQGLTHSC